MMIELKVAVNCIYYRTGKIGKIRKKKKARPGIEPGSWMWTLTPTSLDIG